MLRKFKSFIIGSLITVIFFELLIRVSYLAFEFYQDSVNHLNISTIQNRKIIKIVTVGESATAVSANDKNTYLVVDTAYPVYLEKYLNQKNLPYQFVVENKATLGGESGNVVKSLMRYVQSNKPDIVIVMMGLNDTENEFNRKLGKFEKHVLKLFNYSRIFQFASLINNELKSHRDDKEIKGRISSFKELSKNFIENNRRPVFLDLGNSSFNFDETKIDRENMGRAYGEEFLALYYIRIGEIQKAEEILKKLISQTGYGVSLLASEYQDSNRFSLSEELLTKNLQNHQNNFYAYAWLINFHLLNHNLNKAEAVLAIALKNHLDKQLPLLIAKAKIGREKSKFKNAITTLENQCGLKNQQNFTSVNKESIHRAVSVYALQEDYQECLYLLSELYFLDHQYKLAEDNLKFFINNSSFVSSAMTLLKKVYEAQGKVAETKAFMKNYASKNLRVGEQFALINYLKSLHELNEMNDAISFLSNHFEDTKANFKRVDLISKQVGAELMIMQFPTFSLESMKVISGNLSDAMYVDNEFIFNNAPREKYFFEPKFPYNFNHFTILGAQVLAKHLADEIESALVSGKFSKNQLKNR
jgi:lysophospholipase L1-like esterase/lipopolysaccharide biosynthesis regulator YciM